MNELESARARCEFENWVGVQFEGEPDTQRFIWAMFDAGFAAGLRAARGAWHESRDDWEFSQAFNALEKLVEPDEPF